MLKSREKSNIKLKILAEISARGWGWQQTPLRHLLPPIDQHNDDLALERLAGC
jgi:hypothetical protein